MKLWISALTLSAACSASLAQVPSRPALPASVLVQTDAGSVSLKALVGPKRTMIVFLDPMAPQSRQWLAHLKGIGDETLRLQVVVVLGTSAAIESASADLGPTDGLQVVRDANRAAMRELHVTSLPHVMGVNNDGTIGWSSGSTLPGGQSISAIAQAWIGGRAAVR